MKTPTQVLISKEPIRLSQFLKLANVVQDGLEAKIRITEGEVLVNGILEIRRGRKLVSNDVVQIDDVNFQVIKAVNNSTPELSTSNNFKNL